MAKPNKLQRVLLSAAAQRYNRSLLPFPENIDTMRAAKAIAGLIKYGLAEEDEIVGSTHAWRSDGETSFGLYITAKGEAALKSDRQLVQAASLAAQMRVSKATRLLELLQRAEGATLHELAQATGWLPHTTRAALTGLRKKGHELKKSMRDGVTCYHAGGEA